MMAPISFVCLLLHVIFFLGKEEREKEDKILLRQLSAPIYRRPNRQTVCGMLFENEAEIALKSTGKEKEEKKRADVGV